MGGLTRRRLILMSGATALAAACSPTAGPSPAATSAPPATASSAATADPRALVDALVAQAKQEGQLTATVLPSWNRATTVPKLVDGFKRRFGLNIDFTLTPTAGAQYVPQAMAETSAGTPPTYDAFVATEVELAQLLGAKGARAVENWDALLAAINPEVQSGRTPADLVSPGSLAGYGFIGGGGALQTIVYNPTVMPKDQLPKTRQQLGDPKYKGKFTQPPWTSHWDVAPAVIPGLNKDTWLGVVRAAGRNTGAVQASGRQQVLAGQFAFSLDSERTTRVARAADPNAPIATAYWDDFNPVALQVYSVRTGTKHPAAATLWTLWMTSAEAEAIWQPTELALIIYGKGKFGPSALDQEIAAAVRGVKVVTFFDNAEAESVLKWYGTPEGQNYAAAMAKAIRGE